MINLGREQDSHLWDSLKKKTIEVRSEKEDREWDSDTTRKLNRSPTSLEAQSSTIELNEQDLEEIVEHSLKRSVRTGNVFRSSFNFTHGAEQDSPFTVSNREETLKMSVFLEENWQSSLNHEVQEPINLNWFTRTFQTIERSLRIFFFRLGWAYIEDE